MEISINFSHYRSTSSPLAKPILKFGRDILLFTKFLISSGPRKSILVTFLICLIALFNRSSSSKYWYFWQVRNRASISLGIWTGSRWSPMMKIQMYCISLNIYIVIADTLSQLLNSVTFFNSLLLCNFLFQATLHFKIHTIIMAKMPMLKIITILEIGLLIILPTS